MTRDARVTARLREDALRLAGNNTNQREGIMKRALPHRLAIGLVSHNVAQRLIPVDLRDDLCGRLKPCTGDPTALAEQEEREDVGKTTKHDVEQSLRGKDRVFRAKIQTKEA